MNQTPITPKELAVHPAVTSLKNLQTSLALSDAAFAKTMNLGYSSSAWSRIKAGKYPTPWKVLPALQSALNKSNNAPAEGQGDFVHFDHVAVALAALDIARATTGPIRLVCFVGPTGSGKTRLGQHLNTHFDATIVEAAPSWRRSYLAALGDFASQISLPGEFRSVRAAERAVIQALAAFPRTLVIDEGNYFNNDGLNFLKLILNRTRCTLVLCTLPTDFDRMLNESAHEAKQLVRRAVAIVRVPAVSVNDVRAMAAAGWPELTLGDFAGKIAEGANRFGGYDFVRRVLDETDPEDPGDIPHAIGRVNQLLNTQRLGTKG